MKHPVFSEKNRPVMSSLLILCLLVAAIFTGQEAISAPYGAYDIHQASQYRPSHTTEAVLDQKRWRELDAYNVAMSATIYSYPGVMEYLQLYRQTTESANPEFTPFNTFNHGREMAGPDYTVFKAPNVDTLYSNAWLDLSKGPIVFEVPDTSGRYYTANFIDMYANASNIGQRTYGTDGGKFLIATTRWEGEAPDGMPVFRTTTPYMWVLLRILIDDPSEYPEVHALQDKFTFTPLAEYLDPRRKIEYGTDKLIPAKLGDAMDFFRIADFVIRENGFPIEDTGHVYTFRRIGIGGDKPFDPDSLDEGTRLGLNRGYEDAMEMINGSNKFHVKEKVNNWRVGDVGMYGHNYLHRSFVNHVGLGANVIEEDHAFVTFTDKDGQLLDGAHSYRIHFPDGQTPPVNAFWSLTLYLMPEGTVYANDLNRYALGDRSRDMQFNKDGSLDIFIQHNKPETYAGNWLPPPEGKFWLALRCYIPKQVIQDGTWKPPFVERVGIRQ